MRAARVILMVGVATFVALAAGVLVFPLFPAELAARQALLRLDTGIGAALLRVVDEAGTWRVILPGSLLVFALSPEARARWWVWTVALLAAPAAETFVKEVVGRPRPEALTMGFPSGHATAAAAFFGSVIYLAAPLPRMTRCAVRTLAAVVILLVSISRVSLGAHWPTDALAGLVLGISLASAARLVTGHRGAPRVPPGATSAGGLGGPFEAPHVSKRVDPARRPPPP